MRIIVNHPETGRAIEAELILDNAGSPYVRVRDCRTGLVFDARRSHTSPVRAPERPRRPWATLNAGDVLALAPDAVCRSMRRHR